MTHRVQMYGSDTRVIKAGEVVAVPGGSGRVDIEWPGVGTFPAVICAHPEPVMAQRYFPTLKEASIRACYTAPEFLDLLSRLGNANFGSDEEFDYRGQSIRPEWLIGDFLSSSAFKSSQVWSDVMAAEERYGEVDGVRVAVQGRIGAETTQRVLQYVSRERWLTTHGVAAVAAELIATGAVTAPGVHSAEVLDPALVLPALAAAGIELGSYVEGDAPEFDASV
jgi:saccharopine dehydrogenase-like NADP-dependent oxidoreductase